jgi:hypothetical protein
MLFESIQDLLPSACKSLFLVYLKTFRFLYDSLFDYSFEENNPYIRLM